MMLFKWMSCFFLICAMIFGVAACEQSPPTSQKEIIRLVKTKEVHTGNTAGGSNKFSGVARGVNQSILSFRVPGVLHKLLAEVGTHVKEGDVVAEIDNRDYQLNVDRIKTQFKTVQTQLDQLTSDARFQKMVALDTRIQQLERTVKESEKEYLSMQQFYSTDLMSQNQGQLIKVQLDEAEGALEEARSAKAKLTKNLPTDEVRTLQAQLRTISANLSQGEANLEDTLLKIPYTGVISQKHVSNFEQVAPGQPVYSLVDIENIEIQISIPDRWIGQVASGRKVNVYFTNFSKKRFLGKVTKVGVAADQSTLTYPVFVEVSNPNGSILPGMTAEVVLQLESGNRRYPTLPIHAILEDKIHQTRYVWIYNTETQTTQRREVTLGRIRDTEIEVLNGLKNGEQIVIAGVHRVREGMKVRIAQKTPTPLREK